LLSLEYVKQYGEAHKELNYKQVKLVSNWCQNRKNHNFKRNKGLQTIDFKGFAKKYKKY